MNKMWKKKGESIHIMTRLQFMNELFTTNSTKSHSDFRVRTLKFRLQSLDFKMQTLETLYKCKILTSDHVS